MNNEQTELTEEMKVSADTIDVVLFENTYIVHDAFKEDEVFTNSICGLLRLNFRANVGLLQNGLISPDRRQYFSFGYLEEDEKASEYELLIKAWNQFEKYIKEGCNVRLWITDTADEWCGVYFIMDYMKACTNSIELIRIPDIDVPMLILPKEVRAAYKEKIHVSESMKMQWSKEWNQLVASNRMLRVFENGKVVAKPDSEYDYLLDYYISEEGISEIKVRRMFCERHNSIWVWMALRMKYYMSQGIIEYAGYKYDEYENKVTLIRKKGNIVDRNLYLDKVKDLLEKEWEDVRDDTFSELLLSLVSSKGYKDAEVYKAAKIDRRHFSKIRSNVNYTPSKRTVIALALALKLSEDETEDLLNTAGYTLSASQKADVVVLSFLRRNNYSLSQINEALFQMGLPMI